MDSLIELQKKIISGRTTCLEWSAIRYPKKGETVCGDLFQVRGHQDRVLVAVTDGLGHGREALKASVAAMKAASIFSSHSLITIARHCHEQLRSTRGVVMNLGLVDCRE